ncbi:MAG: HAMP domain-containing protein [Zoogloeaceae bacterium]|jgi:two-component system osmolarity sensor histidine kinase EnvZ|nr:HAMP domain-containing protein [Zoogloeaceae bacterium]
MKAPFPVFARNSLFTHLFLWALLIVLFANAAWMLIFRLADAEPRARSLAQLSASTVNLVRTALLTTSPELRPQLLQELSDHEGIRLLPLDSQDQIEPLSAEFFLLVADKVRQLLGDETLVSLEVNGEPGYWISFGLAADEPNEFWLILPRDRARQNVPGLWMGWGILVALLALVMVWLLASRISRHLARMAHAAQQVGQGLSPPGIPETGPDELRSLASAFNRMSSDLEQNEQERTEILAGISHDLRTPLARMRLEAELSLPDDAAREGMVADITLMDAIIGQFLDYARGKEEAAPEAVNPAALLMEIAQHAQVVGQPVTLILNQLPPDTSVLLKPRSMVRAIENLLGNAWKYGKPPVTLEGALRDGWLEIAVCDCGPGIPESEFERLKRPFTRLESARSEVSGTGLGLAIVERVAKNHHGELKLRAAKNGTGLCAVLRLPVAKPKAGYQVLSPT